MTHHHDHSDHDHHGHGHHHAHDHSHSHGFTGHAQGASEKRIAIAAVLTGAFMLAEVAGGLISGSLALLADAGHMLTDFAALALGWVGFVIARKPGDARRTYGYDRFQVLVAFVNGLTLFVIAGFIVYEAVGRLMAPAPVLGGTMLAIAVVGLLVNVGVFAVLHGADQDNLNIRGAVLHVLGDLLGSVAAIVAALVIMSTGWTPIDPLLSVLVAVIILGSAYKLVRDAGHVLLEGAPGDLNVADMAPHLSERIEGLREVHHVHAWSITPERRMATLHAAIEGDADAEVVIRRIKEEIATTFGIDHTTVEIERGTCADKAAPATRGSKRHDHTPSSHGSCSEPASSGLKPA